MESVEILFPLLWNLSDSFVTKDGKVTFIGTVGEVEEFRSMLKKLDPTATRGQDLKDDV